MDFKEVIENENHIIIKEVKSFDIKQILECGQCFRWEKLKDNEYIIIAFEKVIRVLQIEKDVFIYNSNKEEFEKIWKKYFDLERDYDKIKEKLSLDDMLRKSIEFGEGIRILNQDKFEMLISFIISARNSIPSIKKTVNKIAQRWGEEIQFEGNTYYSFPKPEKLLKANLEDIKETGASFRSKYILDTILKVNEDNEEYDLEKISKLDTDECHKELQKFMGVGAKVADCVMLFSMGKLSAFPVDVWIKRAMIHFYLAPDVSLNKIRVFGRDKFSDLAGIAQQYLFYYARENNIKLD